MNSTNANIVKEEIDQESISFFVDDPQVAEYELNSIKRENDFDSSDDEILFAPCVAHVEDDIVKKEEQSIESETIPIDVPSPSQSTQSSSPNSINLPDNQSQDEQLCKVCGDIAKGK